MTTFIDGQPVTLTGRVTAVEPRTTEVSRQRWATAHLATDSDGLPLYVFPGVWLRAQHHVTDGSHVTIHGRIDDRGTGPRLIAHEVTTAEEATS